MARRAELEQAQIIKEKTIAGTREHESVLSRFKRLVPERSPCGMFSTARDREEVELREIMKISRSSCEWKGKVKTNWALQHWECKIYNPNRLNQQLWNKIATSSHVSIMNANITKHFDRVAIHFCSYRWNRTCLVEKITVSYASSERESEKNEHKLTTWSGIK